MNCTITTQRTWLVADHELYSLTTSAQKPYLAAASLFEQQANSQPIQHLRQPLKRRKRYRKIQFPVKPETLNSKKLFFCNVFSQRIDLLRINQFYPTLRWLELTERVNEMIEIGSNFVIGNSQIWLRKLLFAGSLKRSQAINHCIQGYL